MFRINPSATFKTTVSLTVAGNEPPAVMDVEFRHKGRVAFAAWWESVEGKSFVEILGGIIVSWAGPVDDDGNPVAYSEPALVKLLDHYPPSAEELILSYRRALWESRTKN